MPLPIIGVTARSAVNPDTGAQMDGAVGAYLSALGQAGAVPVIVPRNLSPEALRAVFQRLDGLLFAGGGDISPARLGGETHPSIYGVDEERDALEFALVRWAAALGKPFLGICRGIQVVNAALGGSLYLDIASQRPESLPHSSPADRPGNYLAHRIRAVANSRLGCLLAQEEGPVNSLHHQAVRRLAPGVQAAAWAEDGLIEGVELPDHPFGLAVQWHPELLPDRADMRHLFEGRAAAAEQASGK